MRYALNPDDDIKSIGKFTGFNFSACVMDHTEWFSDSFELGHIGQLLREKAEEDKELALKKQVAEEKRKSQFEAATRAIKEKEAEQKNDEPERKSTFGLGLLGVGGAATPRGGDESVARELKTLDAKIDHVLSLVKRLVKVFLKSEVINRHVFQLLLWALNRKSQLMCQVKW